MNQKLQEAWEKVMRAWGFTLAYQGGYLDYVDALKEFNKVRKECACSTGLNFFSGSSDKGTKLVPRKFLQQQKV